MISRTAILGIGLLMARWAYPQDAPCPKDGRPDCPRAVVFFHGLQGALAKDDRKAIAAMMEYPFLTFINHKKHYVSTSKELLLRFDEVFDKGERCQILGATDNSIWFNSHGFTIKNGAIWFEDLLPPNEEVDSKSPDSWTKGTFKVLTVNNGSNEPCPEVGKPKK